MYDELILELQNGEKTGFEKIYLVYEELLSRFYCREEGEALLDKTLAQKGKSSYIYRKLELVDKLKKAGMNVDRKMTIDELRIYVKKLPDGVQMDGKMFDILYQLYKSYVTPAQYMEKIVRRLGLPQYQEGSVRLSILKQFILNTDYHTGPITEKIRESIFQKTGQRIPRKKADREMLAEYADECLFIPLEHKMTKDEKKKYTLLRLCDDLASGRFRTNGATRLALYMFAFAFNMRFYPDQTSPDYDPDRHIEKNLFFDYYRNHMLRYLKEGEQDKSSDYEAAPLGEGINYKNYAEMIYLYYLNRNDICSREKLKRAEKMIEKCLDEDNQGIIKNKIQESSNLGKDEIYTYVYKDNYLEALNNLKEEDLPEFIISQYTCTEKDPFRTKLMISAETKTAVYHYRNILKNRFPIFENSKSGMEKILSENPDWDKEYVNLIRRLNEMLHSRIRPGVKRITREELIAAFYDASLISSEQEGMSLKELYDDCCQKLNPILSDSRFQQLRITNIFDIYMIIMLYRYLNVV